MTGFNQLDEVLATETIRGLMKTMTKADLRRESFHYIAMVAYLVFRMIQTYPSLLEKDWVNLSTFAQTVYTEQYLDTLHLLEPPADSSQQKIDSPKSVKSTKSEKSSGEKAPDKFNQRMRALVNHLYLELAIKSVLMSDKLKDYLELVQKAVINMQSYSIEMVTSVQLILFSVIDVEELRGKRLDLKVWENLISLQEALLTLLDHKNLDTDQAETACLHTLNNISVTFRLCNDRCQTDPSALLSDVRPVMELIKKYSSSRCCGKLKVNNGILECFTVLAETLVRQIHQDSINSKPH